MMIRPTLSIIIPVKGQNHFTYQCLKSIRDTTALDYEILIHDSPSDDRFNPVGLEQFPLNVHYNQNIHVGMYELLNRTAEHAKGRIFAIINNDIMMGHRALDNCVRAMQEHKMQSVYPTATNPGELPTDFHEQAIARSKLPCELVGPPEWRGWFIMVTREVFWEEMKGFDERFFLYMGDNDFFERMVEAGHPSRQVDNALVHHFMSRTPRPAGQCPDDYEMYRLKWGYAFNEPRPPGAKPR